MSQISTERLQMRGLVHQTPLDAKIEIFTILLCSMHNIWVSFHFGRSLSLRCGALRGFTSWLTYVWMGQNIHHILFSFFIDVFINSFFYSYM